MRVINVHYCFRVIVISRRSDSPASVDGFFFTVAWIKNLNLIESLYILKRGKILSDAQKNAEIKII